MEPMNRDSPWVENNPSYSQDMSTLTLRRMWTTGNPFWGILSIWAVARYCGLQETGHSCRLLNRAEYVAADHAAKEAMWLQSLLSLIGHPQRIPTLIHCDNMGAISLIRNLVFHSCTKHIDVKHHYVQDHVEAQDINFEYIPTTLNSADVLTKGLNRLKHWLFMDMLGIWNKSSG